MFYFITDVFAAMNFGYFLLILGIFNLKMFRFIKGHMKIDVNLADTFNKSLFNYITRQTNLISLIIILILIFVPWFMLHFILFPEDEIITLIYYYVSLVPFGASLCCFLSFKSSTVHYKRWCGCCHSFFVTLCTKCINNCAKSSSSSATFVEK